MLLKLMRDVAITLMIIILLMTTSVTAASLKLRKESDHFKIYASESDLSCVEQVAAMLENSYARICADLGTTVKRKTTVDIYPDLKSYHNVTGLRNPQDWQVGNGGRGFIKMVSPLNPGPTHDFDGMMQVAVHEFTHAAVATVNTRDVPEWLNEGLAAYESGQMDDNRRRRLVKAVAHNLIPTFVSLDTKSSSFGDMGGYQFSYSIVEFLVKQYGWEQVREFVRKPGKPKDIFGVSSDELWQQWGEFLKANYAI